MRTLCEKAGVPYFRFHALRHSGAHTLDQYQLPIRDIQKLLGHESRVTTEIYLKNLPPTEREAIAVLDFTHQFTHNEQLSSESEKVIH